MDIPPQAGHIPSEPFTAFIKVVIDGKKVSALTKSLSFPPTRNVRYAATEDGLTVEFSEYSISDLRAALNSNLRLLRVALQTIEGLE